MDPQITAALVALGLTVITSLGVLVTALTERLKRDLARNTEITKETKEALGDTVERLAAARNTILGLRELLRERDDRLSYLESRLPEVTHVLRGYEDRRRARHSAGEELAAVRRIAGETEP